MLSATPKTTRGRIANLGLGALALLLTGTGMVAGATSCSSGAGGTVGGPIGGSDSGIPATGKDMGSPDAGVPSEMVMAPSSDAMALPSPGMAPIEGLVVVHGSPNLRALRLCFSDGGLGLRPLPDRDLMPESNVVGVEIGSAVRLKPLRQIGLKGTEHVYAIAEYDIRPGTNPDLLCGSRICTANSATCLPFKPATPSDRGYYDLGQLPDGAGAGGLNVLVISGCVRGTGDVATCGADFDPIKGNAKLTLIPLSVAESKANQLLVQMTQVSETVAATQMLTLAYGTLGKPGLPLKLAPGFGSAFDHAQELPLDPTVASAYLTQGFTVKVGGNTFQKSLAEIQLLSAPQTTPDQFYAVKANFAFLLLGNPALSDASGIARSEMTEPGLLLHLLAIPVARQIEVDGGTDEPDAGPAADDDAGMPAPDASDASDGK